MRQYISRALAQGNPSRLIPTLPRPIFTNSSQPLRFLSTATVNTQPSFSHPERGRNPIPAPTKTPEELAGLSYFVRRTASSALPVYRTFKSGGNRQVVLIKKVDGDRRRLLQDLTESLGVNKEDIRINPTTQHVELKGDFYNKAKSWLMETGF